MKSGYDQFFKAARKASTNSTTSSAAEPLSAKKQKALETIEKQLRQRIPVKKSRRAKMNWKLAGLSFLGIIVCLAGVLYHETLEKWVQQIEISYVGSAQAETTTEPAKIEHKEEAKPHTPQPVAAKEEDLTHLQKLAERKKQLDERESELNKLEAEIAKQKVEVEKRMQELENLRTKISSMLDDRVKVDEQKVDSLMQMFSNMKPPQAAKVVETLDEDLAVEILGRMKKKNSAEIMNLLKPEKAQVLSEKYTGYRRQPSGSANAPASVPASAPTAAPTTTPAEKANP